MMSRGTDETISGDEMTKEIIISYVYGKIASGCKRFELDIMQRVLSEYRRVASESEIQRGLFNAALDRAEKAEAEIERLLRLLRGEGQLTNDAHAEIVRLRAALEKIVHNYCVGPLDARTLQAIATAALEVKK